MFVNKMWRGDVRTMHLSDAANFSYSSNRFRFLFTLFLKVFLSSLIFLYICM